MRDTSHPLITEKLTMHFGGLAALEDIDLAVERGAIHAIIGPNGAGKSTFFNCLTGLLRPTSGRVRLEGDDITGLPPQRISQLGVARSYQITNIFPGSTCLENIRVAVQSRQPKSSFLRHHRGDGATLNDAAGHHRHHRTRRQGGRGCFQPVPWRTTKPGDWHRPRDPTHAALPGRTDGRHERLGNPRDR